MKRRRPSTARRRRAVRYPLDRKRIIWIGLALTLAALLSTAAIAAVAWRSSSGGTSVPRAAVVDQLSFTDPNPDFVTQSIKRLQDAGFVVDYFPPEAVTVDFYRALPERGYRFVLLRSHSSDFVAEAGSGGEGIAGTWSVSLFTNELYSSQKYIEEQTGGRTIIERYTDRPIPDPYFGVNPDFIALSTRGRFDNATVVLMGCAGLKTDDLARAFLYRGATSFVSWNASVTAQHTDAATDKLLEHLFTQGHDVKQAVADTMAEVGPDPQFGARLLAYP